MKMGSPFKDELTTKFHDHYRRQTNGEGPPKIKWLGYDTLKCPMDLWIYQEIIYEIQPRYIIEGGTCTGGSALFMATILDVLGYGNVVTIDWDADEFRPKHPRIQYITGNTIHIETVQKVRDLVQDPGRRMLVLDDGHDHDHVYQELMLYAPMLRAEDYLIVEDTNLGGPLWGLERFLQEIPDKFVRDEERERLLLTFNPQGYLKCIA